MTGGAIFDPAFRGDAPVPEGPPPEASPSSPQGHWPRMLKLDEETQERFEMYLSEEIRRARLEKEPLIDDWTQWQDDYWAQPASEVKNFPFQKAANVVIPLTAIAVEAVHARLMNTIFAIEPFWNVRPRNREWIDAAPAVEEWLQIEVEDPDSLDVYGFAQDSLMELIKLGTAVGKSGYERDLRKTLRPAPGDGDQEQVVWIERKNGATLDYVPVANFLMRMHEQDPQEARWVGEEHQFTWTQLKRMSQSGRMMADAVEEIRKWWTGRLGEEGSEDYHQSLNKQAKTEPIWTQSFNVQEIWTSFDVDGDGVDEEVVVDYHYASSTILSMRYNWYQDLHRPYRVTQYVKVEGRWPGIGIGKQNEQFQQEITTIHRQRLDNATLANMRMIAIKKSSGYGPGEPVFPGKMWFLDDTDDIKPLQMSEIYTSAVVNEDQLVRYSDKRTGVNEILLGLPQEGTPGTATGDLARIAEGNKRFDLVLKNVRRWFSLLGADVVANFQQFGNQRRHFFTLDPEEAEWVERVLTMPNSFVREGAIIDLTATDSQTNKQVHQQQWLSLSQILQQYYRNVIELAQVGMEVGVVDPQEFAMIISRALRAADEGTKKLLETFDVQDADRLLFLDRDGTLRGQNGPTGAEALAGQVDRGPTAGGGGALRQSLEQAGLGGLVGGAQGNGADFNRGGNLG